MRRVPTITIEDVVTSYPERSLTVIAVEGVPVERIDSMYSYLIGEAHAIETPAIPYVADRPMRDGLMDWWVHYLSINPEPVIVNNHPVTAPGFTTETFLAGVAKAEDRDDLSIRPAGRGMVRVDSGTSGASYHVTRYTCECLGHQHHGHCYHRAACIYLADVSGVNLCKVAIQRFGASVDPIVSGMAVAS